MARENSFDDIGLEDARRRLQGVSEYMDYSINVYRRNAKVKGENVVDNEAWNLAHDVLEIIHCPEVDKPSPIGNPAIKIEVDTSELDEAIGKAERLTEMPNKNVHDPAEVRGLSKRELIFVLVSNHGWEYNDARNFVEFYW